MDKQLQALFTDLSIWNDDLLGYLGGKQPDWEYVSSGQRHTLSTPARHKAVNVRDPFADSGVAWIESRDVKPSEREGLLYVRPGQPIVAQPDTLRWVPRTRSPMNKSLLQ